MAVEWGIADPSKGFDYLQSLQAIGQAQAQRAQMHLAQLQQGLAQRTFAAKQAEAARAQEVAANAGQLLQSGDIGGARQAAIAGNQLDLAGQIGNLSDDHVKKLATEAQVSGAIANHILTLPQDQWQAAYSAAAPILRQAGFSDQELQQFQLTPEALQAHAAAAQTVTQQIEAAQRNREQTFRENKVDFVPVPQGGFLQGVRADGTLFDGQGGGQAPSAPAGNPTGGGGQYTGGWTPRQRNGGDNSDAAVNNKIAGAARYLGVDPTADISKMNPLQIAQAMTLSEGGRGSLADRNNNPANLRNPDGSYKVFPTKEAGLQAAAQLVARKLSQGQTTVQSMIEGLPAGGRAAQPAAPAAGQVQGGRIYGAPKPTYRTLSPQEAQQRGLDATTRWQESPDGQLSALPAKGDKPLTEAQGKATAYYSRAQMALQQLQAAGGSPPGAFAQFADELPLGIGQHLIGDSDQQQLTARRAFIAAILRQESGAAISQGEFNSYNKLYFDQTGDSKKTRQNKADLRKSALDALRIEAGPGADKLPGNGGTQQTARRTAPAGATRTATGPNGEKIALVNGQWVKY